MSRIEHKVSQERLAKFEQVYRIAVKQSLEWFDFEGETYATKTAPKIIADLKALLAVGGLMGL